MPFLSTLYLQLDAKLSGSEMDDLNRPKLDDSLRHPKWMTRIFQNLVNVYVIQKWTTRIIQNWMRV